jgi:hypothetical protein
MRATFDDGQRAVLKNLGLVPAQLEQLENALPRIRERLRRPIPIRSVREELCKLKNALARVDERIRLKMPKRSAGGEALARLYQAQAQKAQNPHEMVTLQILLKTANDLVDCAIAGLPKSRGRIRRSSPALKGSGELITLIVGALQAGQAAHCRGPANKQSAPPLIRIGPNKRFVTIAGTVSAITGEWSVDEAIRAYRSNTKKIASEEKRVVRYLQLERRRAMRANRTGEKSLKKLARSPMTSSKASVMLTTKVS